MIFCYLCGVFVFEHDVCFATAKVNGRPATICICQACVEKVKENNKKLTEDFEKGVGEIDPNWDLQI